MRTAIAVVLALLSQVTVANAANELINNGLDETYEENVIDREIDGFLFVRNVGCPPAGNDWDPCPEPGDPTTVQLVDGGLIVRNLRVQDSSHVLMTGGVVEDWILVQQDASVVLEAGSVDLGFRAEEQSTASILGGIIQGNLEAWNDAHLDVTGGVVTTDLFVRDVATCRFDGGEVGGKLSVRDEAVVTWAGGSVAGRLEPFDDSTIRIEGRNFAVDGQPVGAGDLVATTGTVSGTWVGESGETQAFANGFDQGGAPCGSFTCSGTITLIDVPEPSRTILRYAACSLLLVLHRRHARRRRRDRMQG